MSFGLTTEGFVSKTVDLIKADIEARFQATFGASVDVSPQSVDGQLIGVMAERFAELWALGQAIWNSQGPDTAVGASLEAICAITGTLREAASKSTVTLTLTGTHGTTVPAGKLASVVVVGTRFQTLADGLLVLAGTWEATTAYNLGDRMINGTSIYLCTTAGVSAGSGGPTGTGLAIGDNTVVWRYLGEGDGTVDVAAAAELTGPKYAYSGTITTIETPVSGWQSVINLLDATLGSDLETDANLRLRREDEIRATGLACLESIREQLLRLPGVIAVTGFENTTDLVDSDGLWPHSFEMVVRGGDNDSIGLTIWQSKPAGIATYGNATSIVTDAQGTSRTVFWSRPVLRNVYVNLALTVDANVFPANGGTMAQDAVVAWGDLQKSGKDVVASALVAQAFSVPGVLDCVAKISFSPSPTSSVTLPISLRELAVYDTSRITFSVTPGIP